MKQRIYLPAEYASLLASKAAAVGVSPDFYVQTLIAQDHICGGGPVPTAVATVQAAAPAPTQDEGITLSGQWGGLSL